MTPALALTPTQQQVVTQFQLPRHFGQGISLHQGGAHTAQLPFPRFRETDKKRLGDDMIENGVAQEFQAFIIAAPGAAMSKRQGE